MDILNSKKLREKAQTALRRGRDPKKLTYTYAAITLAMSLALLLSDYVLDSQIAGTGGLGAMGSRTILETIQELLPMVTTVLSMALNLGFLAGMLRITRGQYADHTDLKVGFRRFFPLVRLELLMGLVYFAVGFFSFQASCLIYMLTPWSEPLIALLEPIVLSGGQLDEATLTAAYSLMGPMFLIFGLVLLVGLVPFLFRFRFANFCLLDAPKPGARAAMQESRRMLRGKFGAMAKLDLSLWPYYLALAVSSLVMYLDLAVIMLGIPLPVDYGLFSLAVTLTSLAVQFAVTVFLRPRAEATYMLAYDALRETPKDSGVVLGNIFDM